MSDVWRLSVVVFVSAIALCRLLTDVDAVTICSFPSTRNFILNCMSFLLIYFVVLFGETIALSYFCAVLIVYVFIYIAYDEGW